MKNFVKYIHQKFDKFVLLVGLLGHGFGLIISTLIAVKLAQQISWFLVRYTCH